MSVNNVVTETLEIVDHNLQASDFDLETLTKSSYIYQLYLLNGEKQTRIVLPEVTSEQKSIKNTRLRERTSVGDRVWYERDSYKCSSSRWTANAHDDATTTSFGEPEVRGERCECAKKVRKETFEPCLIEDEGGPLEAAMQVEASNRRKLLW